MRSAAMPRFSSKIPGFIFDPNQDDYGYLSKKRLRECTKNAWSRSPGKTLLL